MISSTIRLYFLPRIPLIFLLIAWLNASLPSVVLYNEQAVSKEWLSFSLVLSSLTFLCSLVVIIVLSILVYTKFQPYGRSGRKGPQTRKTKVTLFLLLGVLPSLSIIAVDAFVLYDTQIRSLSTPFVGWLVAVIILCAAKLSNLSFSSSSLPLQEKSMKEYREARRAMKGRLQYHERVWRATPEGKRFPFVCWLCLLCLGLSTIGIFSAPTQSSVRAIIIGTLVWCACFSLLAQRLGRNLPPSHPWYPTHAYFTAAIVLIALLSLQGLLTPPANASSHISLIKALIPTILLLADPLWPKLYLHKRKRMK